MAKLFDTLVDNVIPEKSPYFNDGPEPYFTNDPKPKVPPILKSFSFPLDINTYTFECVYPPDLLPYISPMEFEAIFAFLNGEVTDQARGLSQYVMVLFDWAFFLSFVLVGVVFAPLLFQTRKRLKWELKAMWHRIDRYFLRINALQWTERGIAWKLMIDEDKYKKHLPVSPLTAIKVVIEIRKEVKDLEDDVDDEDGDSEEWFTVYHSYCEPRSEEEPDEAAGVMGYLEQLEGRRSEDEELDEAAGVIGYLEQLEEGRRSEDEEPDEAAGVTGYVENMEEGRLVHG